MGRSCPGAEPNESRSALEGELDIGRNVPVNPARNPAIEKIKIYFINQHWQKCPILKREPNGSP